MAVDTSYADLSSPDTFVPGVPFETFDRLRKENPVFFHEEQDGQVGIFGRLHHHRGILFRIEDPLRGEPRELLFVVGSDAPLEGGGPEPGERGRVAAVQHDRVDPHGRSLPRRGPVRKPPGAFRRARR